MGRQAIRRIQSSFEGVGGASLVRRAWLPQQPVAALAVVHGLAEHSGRYEHLGTWFAERGYAVHAYDQRGHGGSSGRRCHAARFDDLLDDLSIFLDRVREGHRGLPAGVIGHSVGGLVVISHLRERQPDVACAVTSGAALCLADGVSPLRLALARALRRLLPHLRISTGVDPSGLSRDPDVARRYVEDPLVSKTLTTSLAAELVAAIERIGAGGGGVQVPVLLLHGADDPLCSVEGSRAFHASLDVPGSALRVYPSLLHEIFNEPEHETLFQDVLNWLQARGLQGRAAS